MSMFTERMIRAAKLDVSVYEEVEADTTAMGQAMGVAVLSSLAVGIGSISTVGMTGILLGTLSALIGWLVWAYLTYFIGAKILPEPQTESSPGELLRTIGFSSSPGLIRILAIIPGLWAWPLSAGLSRPLSCRPLLPFWARPIRPVHNHRSRKHEFSPFF